MLYCDISCGRSELLNYKLLYHTDFYFFENVSIKEIIGTVQKCGNICIFEAKLICFFNSLIRKC